MPLPIIIANTRRYKSKAGPLAFLYDLSALTVYDILLLTSSVSGITDELKLELCLLNFVFSTNFFFFFFFFFFYGATTRGGPWTPLQ
jgi:hypothetical protein